MIKRITLMLTILLTLGGTSTFAANIYVSPNGSNENNGSLDSPLKTLTKAIEIALPGDTVLLRKGVFNEQIRIEKSGSAEKGYITIKAYPGEKPVLDGTGLTEEDMVRIDGAQYIRIQGLEIRNNSQEDAHGIYISDGSSQIEILDNHIHHINTTAITNGKINGGSNAILVRSLTDQSITDVWIQNNDISDCIVGFSEALTISGNVSRFTISGNVVRNITNIGIDIAGHYDGPYQAQDGLVTGNTVYNCHSSYGTFDASGLYIDGAKNIEVSKNIVYNSDYGITIGCENQGKTASDVKVLDNVVYHNDKAGLSIGGWAPKAGRVNNVTVSGNTVYENNRKSSPYYGELTLSLGSNYEIKNNHFRSLQTKSPDYNNLKTFYPMIYNVYPVSKLTLSNNRYYCEANLNHVYYRLNDIGYVGFENYRIGSGQDLNSQFINPEYEALKNICVVDGKSNDWLPLNYLYLNKLAPDQSLRMNNDKRALYVLLNQNPDNKSGSFFFDTDEKSSTGYKVYLWKNIGADYLVSNGKLYKYTGNGNDWKFVYLTTVNWKLGTKLIEMEIPLSYLNIEKQKQISLGFTSRDAKEVYIPLKSQPSIVYKLK